MELSHPNGIWLHPDARSIQRLDEQDKRLDARD
jgi:hypothetical protein